MSNMITHFSTDEKFLNEWRTYCASFAKSGITAQPYLQNEFIADVAAYAGFDTAETAILQEFAAELINRPKLHDLFAFTVYHLQNSPVLSMYSNWPELREQLGEYHNCFYLLAALSLIPGMRQSYREAGIPENIIRDTTLEFSGFYRNHIIGYKVPGIIKSQLFWLKNYRDRNLYRLGRMEYCVAPLSWKGLVLRHRQDSRKLLLAPDGQRYNPAGLAVKADNNVADVWTATLQENDRNIVGHVITPQGRAEMVRTELSLTEWEIFVRPGDKIIDMHIPPGGGLSPNVCEASLRQAAAFFPSLMPEAEFKTFYCYSWIFNTQLEEKLPESNLSQFMREPYLLPVECDRMSGMFFIFSRDNITAADLPTLPRDTSLRRAMLEVLESGEDLRCAGMIYCLEDLQYFGTQYYRRTFKA